MWIATGTTAQSWDVGTNWSLHHSPQTGETAVFGGTGGTNTACYIQPGDNLPTIAGLTMNNYTGTLTLQSNLAANAVTINPRTGIQPGQSEIIINSGSNLYALQSLNWTGGNVGGGGNLEVAGTDTINGTSSADKPTLGTRMDVGTSYLSTNYTGTLTFSSGSLPLVVVQNANIYVNNNSKLVFNNQPLAGQTTATAISNGDTSVHSIIVNTGGELDRTNVCELFVATGLDVEGGRVFVYNPQGQTSGNPLHFTRPVSSAGPGLLVNTGSVVMNGDLTSDYGGDFQGGSVLVQTIETLTLGVNANSTPSSLNGAELDMEGKLVSHGGFTIYSGTFHIYSYANSVVKLDTGNTFYLVGGEIEIGTIGIGASAGGKLEIQGNFEADGGEGTIVDPVNSSNGKYGVLQVDGNADITTATTFTSSDLGSPPPNFTKNWNLMTVGGELLGSDFYYNLPFKWNHTWNGGTLTIQENT